MYNQYYKNEIDDLRTWSKFEQPKYYFLFMGAIFVELVSSNNAIERHDNEIAHEQNTAMDMSMDIITKGGIACYE